MAKVALYALWILLVWPALLVRAGKVLLLPTPEDNSHVYMLRKIYDELTDRGHIAYMVIPLGDIPRLTARDQGKNVSHIVFNAKAKDLEGIAGVRLTPKALINTVMKLWNGLCDDLLSDSQVMAMLQADKPDVIVGIPIFPCTAMLAAKLDVPYISVFPTGIFGNSLMHVPWAGSGRDFHVQPQLATVPDMYLDATHPMTFLQRMQNVWEYVDAQLNDYMNHRPGILALQRKHGIDLTSERARRLETLHLLNTDIALEQPRPLPPNVKLVGPIMAQPAKSLPLDLQEFIDGAGDAGLVLISLGTMAKFGKEETQIIASALGRLPAKTIWKLSKQEVAAVGGLKNLNISDNVKVVHWVPQNDVLGQPQTRAFLSHCGANGLNEAAFHGVPVLGMPFYGDQAMNAQKAVLKGMGLLLRRSAVTEESVYSSFMRLLAVDGFRAAAKKVSRRLRSRKRTPLQEAADWVEHVLETDGEAYMQLPGQYMSFVARNNLDVFAVYLGIAVAGGAASMWLACWVVGSAWRKLKGLAGWKQKLV